MGNKNRQHQNQKQKIQGGGKYGGRKNRRSKYKKERRPLFNASQIPCGLIILAYYFVVTFTPNWMALDTNTSKFMTLSLLNILSFWYLLSRRDIREGPGVLMRFFDTRAGLAFGAFMVVILISFFQAINIHEAVLHFTKMFSVFAAVFILSVILMRDIRYVKMIAILGTLLLIFDSLSVFYYIGQYIGGGFRSITDIKSVYSNKNILASAIFVKIPFAMYLWVYDKGWLKSIGIIGMFTGFLATFFLATRGFYVGLIVITLVYLLYTLYNFYRERRRHHLELLATYLGALILALVIFSVVRANLYPQTASRHTQAVTTQLATIQDDAQQSNRVNAWFWSFDIISKNPVLGVGSGNWKINILEHENQHNPGFIYLYKAHNDFIEITTELGIPGGLIYILIFVFIFWNLIRAYLYKDRKTRRYRHLFLAGFGLMFYGFDAFFNFPHDRPEIQILFAIYLAIGIVTTLSSDDQESEASAGIIDNNPDTNNKRRGGAAKVFAALMIVLMLASSYILYLNFQSSKLQRLIYQEIMSGQLRSSADRFVGHFPWMPNLSVWGESISSLKARYLIQDHEFGQAIDIVKDDRTNPYDSRREYYMAMAYRNLGENDSALVYSRKAYEIKPNYFRNIQLLSRILGDKGLEEEIQDYIEPYLESNLDDGNAWAFAASIHQQAGDLESAWELMEEAIIYNPEDSVVLQQHQHTYYQKFIVPNQDIFHQALDLYNDGEYSRAYEEFEQYLQIVPEDPNAERLMAFSLYYLEEYEECIEAIDSFMENFAPHPSLVNLRGVCYRNLGEMELACKDFEEAMLMGNASGETNYNRFCN